MSWLQLGGGNSNIFEFSTRTLGEWSNLTIIFFKGIGSTTNYSYIFCLDQWSDRDFFHKWYEPEVGEHFQVKKPFIYHFLEVCNIAHENLLSQKPWGSKDH